MTSDPSSKQQIISKTIGFVKKRCQGDSSGHDWWHVFRVHKLACYLAQQEQANLFIVEMAALLHDVDDWKFNEMDSQHAAAWLKTCGIDELSCEKILIVIGQVSFRGAGTTDDTNSIEAMVVQDADRLDAMGAIGIARAFAYGGSKNRMIYNPQQTPVLHSNFEEYKKSDSHTINHFYEKLLLLKDRLKTPTARGLASQRHEFMEQFLDQFHNEWYFSGDQK